MKYPIVLGLSILTFFGLVVPGAEGTPILAGETKEEKLSSNELSTHHGSLRSGPHHEDRGLTGECQVTRIDFAVQGDGTPLSHGDYISDEWLDKYGMRVEASSKKGGYTPDGMARIFDTTFTPSEDPDLNSPNENCPTPGPGIGIGGAEGEAGANCNPKGEGNVLIIQEDSSDTSKPADSQYGGTLSFLFKERTEVLKIGLMDLDPEETSYFTIYREGQAPARKDILGLGDNSIQEETIEMTNVRRIALDVSASFGVRFIELCLANGKAPTSPKPTEAPTTAPPNGSGSQGCYLTFTNVDVLGRGGVGWWVPGNTLGLALLYSLSGSYETNFQVQISDSFCREQTHSVLLSYTSDDNPSENREECINLLDEEDTDDKEALERSSMGIFRFTQGAFVPSLGKKRLEATLYFEPGCRGRDLADDTFDMEVAYGLSPPQVLLLRADNGGEICRLGRMQSDEYTVLNLAKLPPTLNIRAKWDMGQGAKGIDQLLPGTSVRFTFANDFGVPIVENNAPYLIGGNSGDEYYDFSDTLRQLIDYGPSDGLNGLTVEAMSEPGGNGNVYASVYVSFKVIEEKSIRESPACSIAKL